MEITAEKTPKQINRKRRAPQTTSPGIPNEVPRPRKISEPEIVPMVTWNELEVLQNLDVTKTNTSETPTTPPMEDKKERSPTPIDIREKPKWIDIS
ncbi:hypothetical protein WA026_004241 [Henosepilachna vigintioctopunctata]|uniref:Uncharacterized protein n=1 Tax=Henosepilachna vigintioctopunctata TaxID=420089 RepID=A0AAW1UZZ3_9CUCU